jgi:hypothetical protein
MKKKVRSGRGAIFLRESVVLRNSDGLSSVRRSKNGGALLPRIKNLLAISPLRRVQKPPISPYPHVNQPMFSFYSGLDLMIRQGRWKSSNSITVDSNVLTCRRRI